MGEPSDRIIDIGIGQPNFPTPDHIKAAAKRAIDENVTGYTPQPGFQDLRRAVAGKFQSENGVVVSPDQVVVSCGGKHSLYNVIQCLVEPGDEVILLRPYWFANPPQVRYAGGRPVLVATQGEEGFHPDVEAIRAAVTDATKAIVINTPCNPTGAVYGLEALRQLADLAVERDLLVIADEVYERIVFDGAEHVSIAGLNAEIASRTITVNSVSKTHAMTGWRIGYAALPRRLAETVTTLQMYSTSGPCAIAQRAALAALTESQAHVEAMVAAYAGRRRYLLDRLAGLDGLTCLPPEGTFYAFVRISELCGRTIRGRRISGSADFEALLLAEAGVKVVACEGFGDDRHVRISFAAGMEALEEGMDRIERLVGT